MGAAVCSIAARALGGRGCSIAASVACVLTAALPVCRKQPGRRRVVPTAGVRSTGGRQNDLREVSPVPACFLCVVKL